MSTTRLWVLAVVASVLLTASAVRAEDAVADVTLPAIKHQAQQDRLALAQADPMKFLQLALENYDRRIRDYTCLFVKQELVQGKMTEEQHIRVKFREGPFAVFMHWEKNPTMVDRALYVKGRNDDKAMVKPAGWLRIFVPTHVNRPVNGPDSAKVSRRRLDQFGFCNSMKVIHEVNEQARKIGELKYEFDREAEFNGRKTFVFTRVLPNKPGYPDQKMVLHIDQEWLVPVSVHCFDAKGGLLARYEYYQVELNKGLSWKEFSADSCGL